MPGPEAQTIWIEPNRRGGFTAQYHKYLFTGEAVHRKARVVAIVKRMAQRTWCCRRCGDELPIDKRADARFCGEGCRKRAARERRGLREGGGSQTLRDRSQPHTSQEPQLASQVKISETHGR